MRAVISASLLVAALAGCSSDPRDHAETASFESSNPSDKVQQPTSTSAPATTTTSVSDGAAERSAEDLAIGQFDYVGEIVQFREDGAESSRRAVPISIRVEPHEDGDGRAQRVVHSEDGTEIARIVRSDAVGLHDVRWLPSADTGVGECQWTPPFLEAPTQIVVGASWESASQCNTTLHGEATSLQRKEVSTVEAELACRGSMSCVRIHRVVDFEFEGTESLLLRRVASEVVEKSSGLPVEFSWDETVRTSAHESNEIRRVVTAVLTAQQSSS